MAYVGQSLKRFEDHRLLTGRGTYVDDMNLPGMVHALILRSPHANARIRKQKSRKCQSDDQKHKTSEKYEQYASKVQDAD